MEKQKENIELLGKKVGMTQVFNDKNQLLPVTLIELKDCTVVEVKTLEKHGYNAIQLAYGVQKESRLSKALLGHLKKAGAEASRELFEFRVNGDSAYKVGDKLGLAQFEEGEKIDITGKTKGRGFQGVVKRYRFRGGPATHGSMSHRRTGSIGQRQWPGEVQKNKKMPGHMGDVTVTVQNLEIVRIFADKGLILVKGSFPGSNGSIVRVKKAVKSKKVKQA